MDKRSNWPWKKKSSASHSSANQADKGKHGNSTEKPKYVKISIESYDHLVGLEDQVKSYEEQVHTLEDEVTGLNDMLTEAQSEIIDKDNIVKQHAKVAEEAIAGWEKAEAEASTLTTQLESITLLKLTAEERSSHLDGALKECMQQIRNLKEEHDQRQQELIIHKTNLFDKMKLGLESQISSLEQDLLNSAADYSDLSRSLQDRTNMLIKVSEEKSEAEAGIEFLKTKIESCEKEINSLKYEVHVARKEVEIRSEEKDMSLRSLEVVNKQHLEGARKIAKLEAECQRLRTLVRKKLPGPGAMAQMKLEVENFCDPRLRRSLDSSLKWQKENEQLMERLVAMDEHARTLEEALKNRDNELEASRSMCKLLEAQIQTNGEGNAEVGNADSVSCAGSLATVSVSENCYFHKGKTANSPQKPESAINVDLMDDFLEMEKLALASKRVKPEDDYVDPELETAISCIYDFVMNLGKEAKAIQGTLSDEDGLLENFSAKYTGAVKSKNELFDFVLDSSRVLSRLTALKFYVPRLQSEASSSSDCIDKIVLPENNRCPNNLSEFLDSASDPDTPSDGILVPTSEQSKMDKDNLAVDFARCAEDLKITKCLLVETEQVLADVRSQLASAQTSNGLAETQLKCMAESYRALEKRAEDLQTEVNFLQEKIVVLDNELKEEKKISHDAVTRCDELLDKLQRTDTCAAADNAKTSQEEQDIASAAETLAECQETIFLLDKQLKALRPQTNTLSSLNNARGVTVSLEEEMCGVNHIHPFENGSFDLDRTSSELTLDHLLNGPQSPSKSESNNPVTKHGHSKSGSSSASSTPTRGFSRFFSSKGKNVHLVA